MPLSRPAQVSLGEPVPFTRLSPTLLWAPNREGRSSPDIHPSLGAAKVRCPPPELLVKGEGLPRLPSPWVRGGGGQEQTPEGKPAPPRSGPAGQSAAGHGEARPDRRHRQQSRPGWNWAAAECVPNYRSQGKARGLDSVMEMKQNCFLPESLQNSLL